MNIYSAIDTTKVLHIIHRKRDAKEGRVDLVDEEQFLQVATIRQLSGKTFKPHRHLWRSDIDLHIAQESWVVIAGIVKVTLYDTDGSIIHTDMLEPGDCSITLEGGHNYEFIQDGFVYEFKTGPYKGNQSDKIEI